MDDQLSSTGTSRRSMASLQRKQWTLCRKRVRELPPPEVGGVVALKRWPLFDDHRSLEAPEIVNLQGQRLAFKDATQRSGHDDDVVVENAVAGTLHDLRPTGFGDRHVRVGE